MIGFIVALVFLVGSLCVMIGIIIANQLDPNYGSALAIPIFNALSIILAMIGLGISLVAHHKNKGMTLAKRTMIFGVVCVVLLVVLFPYSNSGSLSLVQ